MPNTISAGSSHKRMLGRRTLIFLILAGSSGWPIFRVIGRQEPPNTRCPVIKSREQELSPPLPESCKAIPEDQSAPLNMLVLGDSILWGQGLKEEHKSSYLVQQWLCSSTGSRVLVHREAHSGATLEKTGASCPGLNGEIDVGRPSIREQLDDAVRYYQDRSDRVDVVLMDGCYNDITDKRLVNHNVSFDFIKRRARDACYGSMKPVLSDVAKAFPNAAIVVTGYYPIITAKSAKNFAMRGVFSAVFASEFLSWILPTSKKKIFGDLVPRSKMWAEASDKALDLSVQEVNSDDKKTSGNRIAFAKISDHFGDGSGLSAPRKTTLLWTLNFNSTGRRFVNKGVHVLFHLGTAFETNDELLGCRDRICNPTNDCPEFVKFVCHRAALAHPNIEGAELYANVIEKQLSVLLKDRLKRPVDFTPIPPEKIPKP